MVIPNPPTQNWIKGKEYSLGFSVSAEAGRFQVRLLKNGNFETPLISYIVSNEGGWKDKLINFKLDEATEFLEIWISTKPEFAFNGSVRGWIDDVKILK